MMNVKEGEIPADKQLSLQFTIVLSLARNNLIV